MREAFGAIPPESVVLINCVVYQAGNKLADIPVADISEYISHPECALAPGSCSMR